MQLWRIVSDSQYGFAFSIISWHGVAWATVTVEDGRVRVSSTTMSVGRWFMFAQLSSNNYQADYDSVHATDRLSVRWTTRVAPASAWRHHYLPVSYSDLSPWRPLCLVDSPTPRPAVSVNEEIRARNRSTGLAVLTFTLRTTIQSLNPVCHCPTLFSLHCSVIHSLFAKPFYLHPSHNSSKKRNVAAADKPRVASSSYTWYGHWSIFFSLKLDQDYSKMTN